MGCNAAGFGITDDAVVREAAKQELIRRFFRYSCEYTLGFVEKETVQRAELLMRELGVKPEDRPVVVEARRAAQEAEAAGKGNKGVFVGAAMELKDGSLVAGKNSPLMHAASALVLNAVKRLAEIPDKIPLLSPSIVESVGELKKNVFGAKTVSLDLSEVLICLSINAATNPMAHLALDKMKELQGCEVHITHIPTPGDDSGLRRFGINLTTDPNFTSKHLLVT